MMKKKRIKLVAALCIALFVAVAAELLVFNFSAVKSAGGEWADLPSPEISGQFTAQGGGKFVFHGVNARVDSCRLNVIIRDKEGKALPTSLSIRVTDDGHSSFYNAGTVSYTQDHTRGSYFTIHSYGAVRDIEITPQITDECTVTLDTAQINGAVPVFFSVKRAAAVFLLIAALYLLRPSSSLHDNRIWSKRRYTRAVCVALVLCLNAALLFGLVRINTPYVDIPSDQNWQHHHQYARLVRSMTEGRLSIETPDEAETTVKYLASLEDPYDLSARNKIFTDHNSRSPWDIAYFDGHLYVYFGAVPAVTMYLPYYLLTGSDLPTWAAVYFSLIIVLAAAYVFVRSVVRRFFARTPFTVYILLSALLGNCACAVQFSLAPDFYSLPIAMSVAFVLFGLAMWITAAGGWEAEKGALPALSEESGENCFARFKVCTGAGIRVRLAAGGTLMALVAGCRPQFLVCSILAFPIFWGVIKKEKASARLVRRALLALLPYAVIGAAVMWYNAARFGSPFDFGANYNLTTNDMRLRGLNLSRLPDGFFAYLLQPLNIGLSFPFINETSRSTEYIGQTVREIMCGGALVTNCFLWVIFISRRAGKTLAEKRIGGIAAASLCAAAAVIAADTEMAGILSRYFGDFLLLLYIPAILVFLSLFEKADKKGRARLTVFLTVSLIVTIGFDFFAGVTSGELARRAPESFEAVRSLFI